MKLRVIKYKKFHFANIFVFLSIYIVLIALFFIENNYMPKYYQDIIILSFLVLVLDGILNYFIPKSITLGHLIINGKGKINITSDKKDILAEDVVLFYGGNNKEGLFYIEFLLYGLWFRNGANNYLVINNEIYQIYIDDVVELDNLKDKLLELEKLGVKVKLKKTYFGKRLSRKYVENNIENILV